MVFKMNTRLAKAIIKGSPGYSWGCLIDVMQSPKGSSTQLSLAQRLLLTSSAQTVEKKMLALTEGNKSTHKNSH